MSTILELDEQNSLSDLLVKIPLAGYSEREAICRRIGLEPHELSFLNDGSGFSFAQNLIAYLDKTIDTPAYYRLCQLLQGRLKGEQRSKLAPIYAKILEAYKNEQEKEIAEGSTQEFLAKTPQEAAATQRVEHAEEKMREIKAYPQSPIVDSRVHSLSKQRHTIRTFQECLQVLHGVGNYFLQTTPSKIDNNYVQEVEFLLHAVANRAYEEDWPQASVIEQCLEQASLLADIVKRSSGGARGVDFNRTARMLGQLLISL